MSDRLSAEAVALLAAAEQDDQVMVGEILSSWSLGEARDAAVTLAGGFLSLADVMARERDEPVSWVVRRFGHLVAVHNEECG